MFLPMKRPMALVLVTMLLLVLAPAALAADDGPDQTAPETAFDSPIIDWIDGFFEFLKVTVLDGPWPHPVPEHPGQGDPPQNDHRPHDPGPHGDNSPPEEIGPGAEPGPP